MDIVAEKSDDEDLDYGDDSVNNNQQQSQDKSKGALKLSSSMSSPSRANLLAAPTPQKGFTYLTVLLEKIGFKVTCPSSHQLFLQLISFSVGKSIQ